MDDEISAANMNKLVKAIQAGQKINPVVITKHQGKWLIIDGHHRYFAHLKADVDKIRVVIADPKDLTWRDDVPVDEALFIEEVSSKDNYGIPDGATLAQLDKIAKTAKNPEKRERAHWLRNMRRGKNKKS